MAFPWHASFGLRGLFDLAVNVQPLGMSGGLSAGPSSVGPSLNFERELGRRGTPEAD